MNYIRIDSDRIVREIIPAFDPRFPEIPITERYSPEFLANCLEVPKSVEVKQNWEYLPLENVFKEKPIVEAEEIESMDEVTAETAEEDEANPDG